MSPLIVEAAKQPTHVARILSPKGIYPAESFCFSEGLYVADEELCFSLVVYYEPYAEEELYSELQWLTVAEIRTYGALMLAVDRELGYSAFYPYPIRLSLECEPGDDAIAWAKEFIKPLLIEKLRED